MIFLVTPKHSRDVYGIIAGENAADAVFIFDGHWLGRDRQDDLIREECDDSINNYCERLLTEYDVTELHRHDVLEWIESRLDGDMRISVLL